MKVKHVKRGYARHVSKDKDGRHIFGAFLMEECIQNIIIFLYKFCNLVGIILSVFHDRNNFKKAILKKFIILVYTGAAEKFGSLS